jgi:hypothetical protein
VLEVRIGLKANLQACCANKRLLASSMRSCSAGLAGLAALSNSATSLLACGDKYRPPPGDQAQTRLRHVFVPAKE